jgi:type III pantothenate kinase
MKVDVVVDIGNSRMKWGRVRDDAIEEFTALNHDDEAGWIKTIQNWKLVEANFLISSVAPLQTVRHMAFLIGQRQSVKVLTNALLLSAVGDHFRTQVKEPDRVGIDRLLNAYAALRRTPPGLAAVAISVGTAMTMDVVSPDGIHEGGAILPGPRLMTAALNQHTAQLPHVKFTGTKTLIGADTETAITVGVQSAVRGAAYELARLWWKRHRSYRLYFTGGDAAILEEDELPSASQPQHVDTLTLDGLRLVAERLP